MAKLPSSKETVRDPGLGAASETNNTFVLIGSSGASTKNEVKFYTDIQALVEDHGAGPVVDSAAHMLLAAGGPVGVVSTNDSISGSAGSITGPGGDSPVISITGVPSFDCELIVSITGSGDVGVGKFSFSLDGGMSVSPAFTIPSGGSYILPNGQTLTFPSGGDYLSGDSYVADGAQCVGFGASDVTAAMDALDAAPQKWRGAVVVTSLACGDSDAGALLALSLQASLDAMEINSKYRGGMIDATRDMTEDPLLAFDGLSADRCLIQFGGAIVNAAIPVMGRAFPRIPGCVVQAASAAKHAISCDPKRVLNGSLPRVVEIEINGEVDGGQGLDDINLSTLRTYDGLNGFYITQGRMKSQPGSDFTNWSRRVVMDVACELVHEKQLTFIGRGIRTINNGFIDERDALRFEKEVQDVLDAQLRNPTNQEGTRGHVSGVVYGINRTDNLLSNPTVRSKVGIIPLASADYVEAELGFVASIGDN